VLPGRKTKNKSSWWINGSKLLFQNALFESRNYSKAKGLHEDSLEMALEIGEDLSATMLLDKLAFFKRL
jgi:hypothetical protein